MENPTRRRVLAAGLAGSALGLLGGRRAAAGTTPPADETTTTAPPARPTEADVELLVFAQALELTARDLYQAAIDAGAEDPLFEVLRDNHQAYADLLSGLLGRQATGERDDALYEELVSSFEETDTATLAASAYELESRLVATYTELLRSLQGVDGALAIASILVVEARHRAVLADAAGQGDDFDALFVTDAEPLAVSALDRRLSDDDEPPTASPSRAPPAAPGGRDDGDARRPGRRVRRRG